MNNRQNHRTLKPDGQVDVYRTRSFSKQVNSGRFILLVVSGKAQDRKARTRITRKSPPNMDFLVYYSRQHMVTIIPQTDEGARS